VTVVETPEFIDRAAKLMTDEDREALIALIAHVAANPTAGDLIPGTGGVRKVRWKLEGRGKRGGARIIHFFHNADMPLFLLTAFAKNERTDLSQKERNDFRALTRILVESYRRRKP
jgi:hypothetical protein